MVILSKEQISENILKVKDSIEEAAKQAGRDPSSVTLIGVSKFFPVECARNAFLSGLPDLGENRPEEMHEKKMVLDEEGITPNWHLIGTLQSRKVRMIVGEPYLIHSVDTLSLAKEISKRSVAKDVVTRALLEVNVSGEESKHGFSKQEVLSSMDELLALPNLELCGLMTMAPIEQRDGEAREVFEKAKVLFEQLKHCGVNQSSWKELSMGMSGDYKDAIICGSTYVRIGTAIFGKRDYPTPQ